MLASYAGYMCEISAFNVNVENSLIYKMLTGTYTNRNPMISAPSCEGLNFEVSGDNQKNSCNVGRKETCMSLSAE